jgi:hypothetical protein
MERRHHEQESPKTGSRNRFTKTSEIEIARYILKNET